MLKSYTDYQKLSHDESFRECIIVLSKQNPNERDYKVRSYYLNMFLLPYEQEDSRLAFCRNLDDAFLAQQPIHNLGTFFRHFQEKTIPMIKAFLLKEIFLPEQKVHQLLEEKHQVMLDYFRSRLVNLIKALR